MPGPLTPRPGQDGRRRSFCAAAHAARLVELDSADEVLWPASDRSLANGLGSRFGGTATTRHSQGCCLSELVVAPEPRPER